MQKNIAIVGAGFSGAVIANQLAKAGYTVEIFESRPHIAGNCHSERDADPPGRALARLVRTHPVISHVSTVGCALSAGIPRTADPPRHARVARIGDRR